MRSGTIPQAALFPRPHDVAVFRVIASSSRKKVRLPFSHAESYTKRRYQSVGPLPVHLRHLWDARSSDKPNTVVRCLDLVDKAFPGSRASIGQYGSFIEHVRQSIYEQSWRYYYGINYRREGDTLHRHENIFLRVWILKNHRCAKILKYLNHRILTFDHRLS